MHETLPFTDSDDSAPKLVTNRNFRTPVDEAATRHLFIANCGEAAGLSVTAIKDLLKGLGALEIQLPNDKRSIVFASFKSVEAAKQALKALQSDAIQQQYRKFTLKFAELANDQKFLQEEQEVHLDTKDCGVPGLILIPEFVSTEEELELLACADGGAWEALANRRVQHYGHKFDYKTRSVGEAVKPIPPAAARVLGRLNDLNGSRMDQLTVNEYPPGIGLAPHIDTHSAFTGAIASLSLSCGCVMEMRRGEERQAVYLPPRSLLIMSGASRYEWQHYIPHRKSDRVEGVTIPRCQRRVSFTFRQIRGFPCECSYPQHCDSQEATLPLTRLQQSELESCRRSDEQKADPKTCKSRRDAQSGKNGSEAALLRSGAGSLPTWSGRSQTSERGYAPAANDDLGETHPSQTEHCEEGQQAGMEGEDAAVEKQHVHAVYEVIASHFSATRYAVWPKVREFLMGLPQHGILADVGCGNGKYFSVRPDMAVLGSDRSFGLARQAMKLSQPVQPSGTSLSAGPVHTKSSGTACERLGRESLEATDAVSKGKQRPETRLLGLSTTQFCPLADVVVADALHLPYQNGCADGAISIAVVHHISRKDRRICLLTEMARVLRAGALGLVTVWASCQEDPKKMARWECLSPSSNIPGCSPIVPVIEEGVTIEHQGSNDYFVPWHVPFHRADAVSALRSERDALRRHVPPCPGGEIDRERGSVVYKRYYHLFDKGELEDLVCQVPNLEVTASFYDKSNWCCIFRKCS